jgi:DNA-binding SARP family transcriptional activator
VVFFVDPEGEAGQLKTCLAAGEGLAVGGVVVGDWPHGTVIEVDSTGLVVAGAGLVGAQMHVMTQTEAAERVTSWFEDRDQEAESTEPPVDEMQQRTAPMPAAQVETVEAPPGLIRLMGVPCIEGPHETQSGKSAGMWPLLALLAENRNNLVSRSLIEEKLWPDGVPYDDAFNNLMRESRNKLGDAVGVDRARRRFTIENSGNGYRISHALYSCDVWQFRDLMNEAATAAGADRGRTLEAAVELYKPYLEGIGTGQAWIRSIAHQLRRDTVQALAELADLEAAPDRAVLFLERATRIDCTNEHLFRQRMRLYGDLGRRSALRYCYEELDDALKALGKSPETQTIKLYQRLTSE